ncbi:MAG: hypothetical protein Q9162_004712 [Coniocarpon cinnabarinum]
MAPLSAQPAQQLRQLIWYHLDNELVDNATFLAGRLHAYDARNPESIQILALCYLRSGQLRIAYDCCRPVIQKRDHPGCAYVFAQACLGLERYQEGITILERSRATWESRAPLGQPQTISCNRRTLLLTLALGKCDSARRPTPDAAAFHCVLGKLEQGNGDRQKAINSYAAALKLNPFMWDAYERLCDLGE